MVQEDADGPALIKKPTAFMTNAPEIAKRLTQKCEGGHRHITLIDGRAKRAEVYPEQLCREILLGLVDQMRVDGRLMGDGCVGSVGQYDEHKEEYKEELQRRWDDVSGKELDSSKVKVAREEEMQEFRKHKVYTKVPLVQCWNRTGKKPIGVRWIDINKGDDKQPKYRSRLVAKEIKIDNRDDLFAATPPLEAKKLLLTLAMTESYGFQWGSNKSRLKLDFIDVRRAFFHAKCRREVYVELPPEDGEPGMCGMLNMAMYGTRDAPQNWEFEYGEFMESVGFSKGKATPCLFYHECRNLRCVVYGDDFTILGEEKDLDWFRKEMVKRYEVEFKARLGGTAQDDKAVFLLNRPIEWTAEGMTYEADQRHVEIILRDLGLQGKNRHTPFPYERVGAEEVCNPTPEVSGEEATMFRSVVARANYLSQDRSDIRYAVKELSRAMSAPRVGDINRLKRFGRYLSHHPRLQQYLKPQGKTKYLDVWVDTDFAGCLKTRKSTSGGVVMFGQHIIKTWSSTQTTIALSSGEAEYYGMVKGAAVAMGIKSMFADLGVEVKIRVRTDASAAKGIASRRGLGKVRHIEVNQLWLQEKVGDGTIEIMKVKGEVNPADAMTKPLDGTGTKKHLELTGQAIIMGRHELTPDFEYDDEENVKDAGIAPMTELREDLQYMHMSTQVLDLLSLSRVESETMAEDGDRSRSPTMTPCRELEELLETPTTGAPGPRPNTESPTTGDPGPRPNAVQTPKANTQPHPGYLHGDTMVMRPPGFDGMHPAPSDYDPRDSFVPREVPPLLYTPRPVSPVLSSVPSGRTSIVSVQDIASLVRESEAESAERNNTLPDLSEVHTNTVPPGTHPLQCYGSGPDVEMGETESMAESDTVVMRGAVMADAVETTTAAVTVTEKPAIAVPVPSVPVSVPAESVVQAVSVGEAVQVEPAAPSDLTSVPDFAVRNLESTLMAEPVSSGPAFRRRDWNPLVASGEYEVHTKVRVFMENLNQCLPKPLREDFHYEEHREGDYGEHLRALWVKLAPETDPRRDEYLRVFGEDFVGETTKTAYSKRARDFYYWCALHYQFPMQVNQYRDYMAYVHPLGNLQQRLMEGKMYQCMVSNFCHGWQNYQNVPMDGPIISVGPADPQLLPITYGGVQPLPGVPWSKEEVIQMGILNILDVEEQDVQHALLQRSQELQDNGQRALNCANNWYTSQIARLTQEYEEYVKDIAHLVRQEASNIHMGQLSASTNRDLISRAGESVGITMEHHTSLRQRFPKYDRVRNEVTEVINKPRTTAAHSQVEEWKYYAEYGADSTVITGIDPNTGTTQHTTMKNKVFLGSLFASKYYAEHDNVNKYPFDNTPVNVSTSNSMWTQEVTAMQGGAVLLPVYPIPAPVPMPVPGPLPVPVAKPRPPLPPPAVKLTNMPQPPPPPAKKSAAVASFRANMNAQTLIKKAPPPVTVDLSEPVSKTSNPALNQLMARQTGQRIAPADNVLVGLATATIATLPPSRQCPVGPSSSQNPNPYGASKANNQQARGPYPASDTVSMAWGGAGLRTGSGIFGPESDPLTQVRVRHIAAERPVRVDPSTQEIVCQGPGTFPITTRQDMPMVFYCLKKDGPITRVVESKPMDKTLCYMLPESEGDSMTPRYQTVSTNTAHMFPVSPYVPIGDIINTVVKVAERCGVQVTAFVSKTYVEAGEYRGVWKAKYEAAGHIYFRVTEGRPVELMKMIALLDQIVFYVGDSNRTFVDPTTQEIKHHRQYSSPMCAQLSKIEIAIPPRNHPVRMYRNYLYGPKYIDEITRVRFRTDFDNYPWKNYQNRNWGNNETNREVIGAAWAAWLGNMEKGPYGDSEPLDPRRPSITQYCQTDPSSVVPSIYIPVDQGGVDNYEVPENWRLDSRGRSGRMRNNGGAYKVWSADPSGASLRCLDLFRINVPIEIDVPVKCSQGPAGWNRYYGMNLMGVQSLDTPLSVGTNLQWENALYLDSVATAMNTAAGSLVEADIGGAGGTTTITRDFPVFDV